MGKPDELKSKRPEIDFLPRFHHMQFNLVGNPFFFELTADKRCRERIGIKRHAQISGQIWHSADMILVAMRKDNPDEILLARLDKFQIGENKIDPGIICTRKCQAQIDHQPFAVTTI